mgnify:FL=1
MKNLYAVIFCLTAFGFSLFGQNTTDDLYAEDVIQDFTLEFAEDNWRFILDSLRFNGDEMLEGELTINGQEFPGVGVRIRDTHSFKPGEKRNNLHIQLNYTDADQHYQGYPSLKLSTALRDPSMVREVLGFAIARDYMPAPKANYAKLLINDEYYGLMVNIEPVDSAPFLERYFSSTEGSLFLSDPVNDEDLPAGCSKRNFGALLYESNTDCYAANFRVIQGGSVKPVQDLARYLSDSERNVEEILHVDRTLWMLAFNNVVVNLDSYSGQKSPNYFLYEDADGLLSPIIWDLNLAFGSFKNTGRGSDLSIKELQQLDPLLHADHNARPLISKLLEVEAYRKIYLSHIRTILNDYFVNEVYKERIETLQENIRVPLITDRNRYYTSDEFANSLTETIGELSRIPGLVSFMDKRASWLKKTPELIVVPPQFGRITYKEREQFSRERVETFHIQVPLDQYTREVHIAYRFGSEGPFTVSKMADDGNSFDEKAGDHIFGIILDPPSGKKTLEFYLKATNARAVSFSPMNYVAHKHRVSLSDLN